MASDIDQAFTYTFHWIGIVDARTCAKCKRLIGREYHDQDLFQDVLWDPIEGDIFDLNRGISLAHGGGPHFCRCTVTVDVQSDIRKITSFTAFQNDLEQFLFPLEIKRIEAVGDMSADIAETRRQVEELKRELNDVKASLSEVTSLLNLSLSLTRRISGDENINNAIANFQRAILIANQLRLALIALEAASGPVGWVLAGLNIAAVGVSIYEVTAR